MSGKELKVVIEPSPITPLRSPLLEHRRVQLLIKRDDLLQPGRDHRFCGNKVRKLKYNLEAARQQGADQLLTFGGAYSNHIAAVARAGALYGFRTVGVIRGEPHEPLNPTLAQATADGMQIHYLDRTTYRQKHEQHVQQELLKRFGASYLLPEGGTNALALKGCTELANEIKQQLGSVPDYLAVACGTGGTMAGLIQADTGHCRVLGVSALKGDWMTEEIEHLLGVGHRFHNWQVFTRYHFGGYARFPLKLREFMQQFEQAHGVTLDPVYTGKLFFGILDQVKAGFFPPGSSIVVVHSGGLQGINDDLRVL